MTALLVNAILLVIASVAPAAHAEGSKWKQITDSDDVTAWTQETGDGLPIARASTSIDAGFCETLAVLRDVERHCEWMADCVATKLLRRRDWEHVDMYLRIKGFPWVGVADRDAVLQTVTVVEEPGKKAQIRFSAAAADTGVLADDTVHMPQLTGAYTVTRVGEGKTEIDYRFHVDLGGWVPGWVGTQTVEQLPHRTLVKLRSHVAQTRGEYRAEIEGWPPIEGVPTCGSDHTAQPSLHR